MSTPLDAPPDTGGRTPDRQCGRCRRWFPGDPMLHPIALAEWWACPSCRAALFGTRASHRTARVPNAEPQRAAGGTT